MGGAPFDLLTPTLIKILKFVSVHQKESVPYWLRVLKAKKSIPGLEKMNPNPNPKNSTRSQEILGIPIPKIHLRRTSSIGKKREIL